MRGMHCIKFWSKTQSSVVTSTAEAELVALVKGTSEAKGIASIMKDVSGKEAGKIGVYTDASAAIGITQRQGIGKTRHIDVGLLWIQQSAKRGEVDISKVEGVRNPADMFTKAVPAEVIWRHMKTMGFENREGRAEEAIQIIEQ